MKRFALITFAALTVMASSLFNARATEPDVNTAAINDDAEAEYYDFEHEKLTPEIKKGQREAVKNRMRAVATNLIKQKYDAELMRNGEVVVLTLPSDDIFIPNTSDLLPAALTTFKSLIPLCFNTVDFKILIAVHTDDTGSDSYLLDLSEDRVIALLDYFESQGLDVDSMIGFPMGADEPIADNDTRIGRAENRRVEFYFVPTLKLASTAK